jgi:hypothetical protein
VDVSCTVQLGLPTPAALLVQWALGQVAKPRYWGFPHPPGQLFPGSLMELAAELRGSKDIMRIPESMPVETKT